MVTTYLWLFAFLIGIVSILFIRLMINLSSSLSGWTALARVYLHKGEFQGEGWRHQSAQMRWLAKYNFCLTVGANPQGLYISILRPFRFAHPALFLPWRAVSSRQVKFLGRPMTELLLGRETRVPFRIDEKLAARLRSAAGQSWPTESAR